MESEYRGRTDRQRAIDWLKNDLSYYRLNIGETTEFGTVITEKLIHGVERRIKELEKKENANKRRLSEFA